MKGEIVPDLSADVVEHTDLGYRRPSVANPHLLYYLAENDRPEGVLMHVMMEELGLSRMSQGHVAIAMKDAVRFGYADRVSPRVEEASWRVTEKGRAVLGLD